MSAVSRDQLRELLSKVETPWQDGIKERLALAVAAADTRWQSLGNSLTVSLYNNDLVLSCSVLGQQLSISSGSPRLGSNLYRTVRPWWLRTKKNAAPAPALGTDRSNKRWCAALTPDHRMKIASSSHPVDDSRGGVMELSATAGKAQPARQLRTPSLIVAGSRVYKLINFASVSHSRLHSFAAMSCQQNLLEFSEVRGAAMAQSDGE